MAAGVELATAYVSLTVSTDDIGKQIGKSFASGDKIAAKAGKSMGKALSQGVEQGTDVDLDGLRAEVETAEKQITATVERTAEKARPTRDRARLRAPSANTSISASMSR